MNLNNLSNIIGTPIKDKKKYEEAFTHKSYANEHGNTPDNERLEFLGDAVLELIITEYLFLEFPHEPEGKMTKLRSALVSGVSLSLISKQLGFGELLRLSRGEEQNGGRKKSPILANVFEAVIGAMFLDSGLSAVKKFIHLCLLPRLPEVIQKNLHLDAKSAFQELSQEKWDITPEYKVLSESGPDHQKIFSVGVFVEEKQMGVGEGSSKQKAEVDAAENALVCLSQENPDK